MINLSIWLYGKPSWDLAIEGKTFLNSKIFREHGDYLRDYLHSVAEIVDKLQFSGWEVDGALYTLEFYKQGLTKKQAKKELKELAITPELYHLEEVDEEFEE